MTIGRWKQNAVYQIDLVFTETFHNTPELGSFPTNNNSTDRGTFGTEGNHVQQASPMQLVYLSHTQDGYGADSRGLSTVPVRSTQAGRTCRAEKSTVKSYSDSGINAELMHRCKSEDIDSSKNGMLHIRGKTAHLFDVKEQETTQKFLWRGTTSHKATEIIKLLLVE